MSVRYSELMASVESICRQADAQADAHARTRSDLARLQASAAAGADLDALTNAARINDDIRELTRTIRDIDSAPLDDDLQPLSSSLTPAQAALAQKLHLQTRLLALMKRRLVQYQSKEPALTALVHRHGSIDRIADRLQSLDDENARLRLRERRFEHDPLLKRRPLGSVSVAFLHCLVALLQNELDACRPDDRRRQRQGQDGQEMGKVLHRFDTTLMDTASCDTMEAQRRLEQFARRYRSGLDRVFTTEHDTIVIRIEHCQGDLDHGRTALLEQTAEHLDGATTALRQANRSMADLTELCQTLHQDLAACRMRLPISEEPGVVLRAEWS